MTWPGIIILFVLLILGSPFIVMVFGLGKVGMVIVLTMGGAIAYKVYRDNNPLPPAAP